MYLVCWASTASKSAPESESAADKNSDADSSGQAETKDPYAVPADASAEELFKFIRRIKRRHRTTIESETKSARAAVAGAEAIRKIEGVDLENETNAFREQLIALRFLAQFDANSAEQLKSLVNSLENDSRPEIASLLVTEAFKLSCNSASTVSKEEQIQLIAELKDLLADREFDREAYGWATGLARAIGKSGNSELAASLYEDLAEWMSESNDNLLRERARKMVGAARRMRLPGNFMEVVGTTTEGG